MNCHSFGRTLSPCMISCHVTFTPSHLQIFSHTHLNTQLIPTLTSLHSSHSSTLTHSLISHLTTLTSTHHTLTYSSHPHYPHVLTYHTLTHSSHTSLPSHILTHLTHSSSVLGACEALIFETLHEKYHHPPHYSQPPGPLLTPSCTLAHTLPPLGDTFPFIVIVL